MTEAESSVEGDCGVFAAEVVDAVKRDHRNLPALLAQAEILFAAGRRDDAVSLLETADKLAPGAFLVLRTLSGFLLAMDQLGEAERLAERAVEIAPEAAEARLHLAGIKLVKHRHQAAIPHLLAHVSHAQATPAGWHLLSVAMSATGQPHRAIEAIRRAIGMQAANTDYRLHLASLLTSRARYGDALTELGLAAATAPMDARIPRAASGNHEALGDLTAAYQEAKRALELAPSDAEIRFHYEHLARQMGFTGSGATVPAGPLLAGWEAARPRKVRNARQPPPGLRRKLRERGRIIYALVLRDMRTRYSQSHLGYLWAVFEPISHLLTLGVVFALINQAPPPIGSSLFEYYCTGLLPYLMFSHIATDVMGARASSSALLLLPKIRTTDIVLGKTFLNLMTEAVVGAIVFTAFGAAGYRTFPAHLFPCAGGIFLLALLAMGIGTINMVIRNFFHSWETVFASIVRLLYFASGIYYSPIEMPDYARNFLQWNPILQGVEIFRSGFFPDYHPFWINEPYLVAWVLITLMLGLGMEQVLRRRLKRHL